MFGIKKELNKLKRFPRISLLDKYAYCENLIRDATSDNNWGPTSLELNELSHLSFRPKCLSIICKRLTKRLNSSNPIAVLKALTVIYFLLETGSGEFIEWAYTKKYLIRSLTEFQGSSRKAKKLGDTCSNVRQKAVDISELLKSKSLLIQRRQEFKNMRLSMKLPSPRSSLDLTRSTPSTPITDPGVFGGIPGRRTQSLDIYNRQDMKLDGLSNALKYNQSSLERSGSDGVVFTTNKYPNFSRALNINPAKSKLGDIVEMDEGSCYSEEDKTSSNTRLHRQPVKSTTLPVSSTIER